MENFCYGLLLTCKFKCFLRFTEMIDEVNLRFRILARDLQNVEYVDCQSLFIEQV